MAGAVALLLLMMAGVIEATAEPRILSARELAKVLGCSENHIHNLKARGQLPYRKLGNLTRYVLDEVLEATKESTATRASGGHQV